MLTGVKNAVGRYEKELGKKMASILRYGVEDNAWYVKHEESDRCVFALIGIYQYIKAQDLFLESIDRLDKSMLKKRTFLLIGKNVRVTCMIILFTKK